MDGPVMTCSDWEGLSDTFGRGGVRKGISGRCSSAKGFTYPEGGSGGSGGLDCCWAENDGPAEVVGGGWLGGAAWLLLGA